MSCTRLEGLDVERAGVDEVGEERADPREVESQAAPALGFGEGEVTPGDGVGDVGLGRHALEPGERDRAGVARAEGLLADVEEGVCVQDGRGALSRKGALWEEPSGTELGGRRAPTAAPLRC